MMRPIALAMFLLCGAATAAPPPPKAAVPDIAFDTFTLPNGLTVIVHEDHKAPIVAVDLWYHVGSKNEQPGKTGFAHLFEHLMFEGSEHSPNDFHRPFELVGATDQNGTTDNDRTNFFENVPTTALDMALWMESDRMGHLLPAVDQAKLDQQRGVVQNEKRQRENQPYGRVWGTIHRAIFPAGHPYSWETIGSMEDLNAASLDDVKAWFQSYYGAANVVLVLAGDIDLATAKEKVTKYFGHIASGPPVDRPGQWIAARTESTRETMTDRVPQTRIFKVWNVPGQGDDDEVLLGLASQVLGGSAASRLDARLVYREQTADSVGTFVQGLEIAGIFGITATVKQGVDPAKVEAALDAELKRLLETGPTVAELERAKTVQRAGFARGIERVGGFGGKADALAACFTYEGDPGCFRKEIALMERATPQMVRDAARRWLARGDYTLTVVPFGEFTNAKDSAVDRSAGPPKTERFPDLTFPALERGKLKNGVPVILARRAGAPVLDVTIQFRGGYTLDLGRKLGTASLAMGMLDEGAGAYDALGVKTRGEELGAQLGGGAGLDASSVGLATLPDKLEPSLALLADMVRRPRFDPAELERVKKQRIAGIAQEKSQPVGIALRLLPPLLFGAGHPYSMPFSGSGNAADVAQLTREDLLAFQRDFLRPDNATIIVAGDTTLERIVPELDKHFGDWSSAGGAPPPQPRPVVGSPAAARVFLVDKPGAIQTLLIAGQLAPSSMDEKRFELETANAVFGGTFTSRLNMNLREEKHWAYGASSYLAGALGQRPLMLYASVQTDKTRESIVEMRKELAAFLGDKPATAAEIAKIKADKIRSLPGSYETIDAVAGQVASMQLYNRPDDYVLTYKARIEAQSDDEVRAQAKAVFTPDRMTWVIVGDLAKIEKPIRELSIGETHVMDTDGNIVR
jgi:predicted Zn-dependent peptidase